MIGLNIGNDSKHMRENNNNYRRSYQFATKNYGKFYVSGISGSLEKHTKEKMEIDRKFIKSNSNTTNTATNHSKYIVEPVLEKHQRDQLKRDALQLIQLEQKLLDIQRYKECKKRRNELRIRKRLEYNASMKIATAYLKYRDNKYSRAVQVLQSFLHVVTMKQSLSAAAWAARVIKRFAIFISYKWRRYLLFRDHIPAVVNRNWSLIEQVSCMTVQLVRRQVDELVTRWFTIGLRSISRLLAYERKKKQKQKQQKKQQQLLQLHPSSRKEKGTGKGWKRDKDKKHHEHDDHLQFFLTEFDSKSSNYMNGGDDDDDDDGDNDDDDDDNHSSVYSNDHQHHYYHHHHHHGSNDGINHELDNNDDSDDDNGSSSSEDSEGGDGPNSYHRLKHGPSYRRPPHRHHSISDLTASAQSLLGLMNDDGMGKKKRKKKVYDESNEEHRRIISLHRKRQEDIKKEKVRRLQLMDKQRAIREQEEQLKQLQEVEESNLERQRKQKIVELANESRVKARNYRLTMESKNQQQQQQQQLASNKQNRDAVVDRADNRADDTKTVTNSKKSDIFRQHQHYHQHHHRHPSDDDADAAADDRLLMERKDMISEDKPIHRPSPLTHSIISSSKQSSSSSSSSSVAASRSRPNSALKVKQATASNNLDWVDMATNDHHPGKHHHHHPAAIESSSCIVIAYRHTHHHRRHHHHRPQHHTSPSSSYIAIIIMIVIIIMHRHYYHDYHHHRHHW